MVWQTIDDQLILLKTVGSPRLVINLNTHQRQLFTVQYQRRLGISLTFNFADGSDVGDISIQFKIQVDIGDGVICRTIIVAILHLRLLCNKILRRL